MMISDVNDDLIDEDKLNEIKADEPEPVHEKEVQPQATVEEAEVPHSSADLYQLNEDEIVRMLSYKQGRRVKTIKAVLENKLKTIVDNMDTRINALMEVKEVEEPKDKKKK